MTLDYYDLMNADLSSLVDASEAWNEMGKRFGELRTNYKQHVRGLTDSGSWTGVSAIAFEGSSNGTLHEFQGAKNQAIAIGKLLKDAHTTLNELKEGVKTARQEAIDAKMKVDAHGNCTYDFDKLTDDDAKLIRRDLRSQQETERYWTKHIAKAVKKVADADEGTKRALKEATKDEDGKGDSNGFNSKAMGDIEKYEAKHDADLAMKLNAGENLPKTEIAELQRSMRGNAKDTAYSRTLLNSLGHDGLIKFTNRLSDLTHDKNRAMQSQYSSVEKSLAAVLATATAVKGADKDGDRTYRNEWLKEMKKAGVKEYGLEVVNNQRTTIGDQKARGYQSLVTLMQNGSGYDKGFLHGLADDIREVEDSAKGGDPGIWDLDGKYSSVEKPDGTFSRSENGWFANDPLDGVLGVMSKNPDVATDYFDPDSDDGSDRLRYLQQDRDWQHINDYDTNKDGIAVPGGGDICDADNRTGFGAALEAAITGSVPGSEAPEGFRDHSDSQVRVLEKVVGSYASLAEVDQGAMPENIRQNMANAIAYYPSDVHEILGKDIDFSTGENSTEPNDVNVSDIDMHQFIRAVAEDGGAFRTIHDSQVGYIAEDIYGLDKDDFASGSDRATGAVREAGRIMGTLDEVRADTLSDHRDEQIGINNWNKTYQYHSYGVPLTLVPGAGDALQRMLDIGAGQNAEHLNDVEASKTKADLIELYEERGYPRLRAMIEERATEVGITSTEIGATGGTMGDIRGEANTWYNNAIGNAAGSTGEAE